MISRLKKSRLYPDGVYNPRLTARLVLDPPGSGAYPLRYAERMKATPPQFTLRLPSGFQIHRDAPERETQASASKMDDMKTGYIWYTLPEEKINETKAIFSLCYNHGCLGSVRIDLTDEKYGHGWDDWSEEKEKLRARDTKQFLSDLGYPPNTYEWGEVWASFDPKGGFGTGGIRYKNEKHNRVARGIEPPAPTSPAIRVRSTAIPKKQ